MKIGSNFGRHGVKMWEGFKHQSRQGCEMEPRFCLCYKTHKELVDVKGKLEAGLLLGMCVSSKE